MSRHIDMDDRDSWTEEDLQYLAARDLLPPDLAADYVFDDEARKALSGDIATPRPIEETVHTGNVNTAGVTQEEFDRALELLRMEQEGELEVDGSPPEDTEDEDYDGGWNNDQRRAELSGRGLSTVGHKDELMARLLRSDTVTLTAEDFADGQLPEGYGEDDEDEEGSD